MNKKVKFIRKNGKVIPIRSGGGVDLRSKSGRNAAYGNDFKNIGKIYKKHGKRPTKGERIKGAAKGAFVGSIFALPAIALAAMSTTKKCKAIGYGLTGIITGLVAMAGSSDSKTMSKRKFNKKLGKLSAKQLKEKGYK